MRSRSGRIGSSPVGRPPPSCARRPAPRRSTLAEATPGPRVGPGRRAAPTGGRSRDVPVVPACAWPRPRRSTPTAAVWRAPGRDSSSCRPWSAVVDAINRRTLAAQGVGAAAGPERELPRPGLPPRAIGCPRSRCEVGPAQSSAHGPTDAAGSPSSRARCSPRRTCPLRTDRDRPRRSRARQRTSSRRHPRRRSTASVWPGRGAWHLAARRRDRRRVVVGPVTGQTPP